MESKGQDHRRQWHGLFGCLLEMELKTRLPDIYHIEFEYPLNQQPLQIDALVVEIEDVQKVPDDYNLARIYSKFNIHEFKSPEESLNIIAYNKGLAYAHLFMDIKTVMGVNNKKRHLCGDELSLTFICSRNPVKLIRHLRENRHFRVEYSQGIYHVYGEEYTVQIAVTSHLPDSENIYLRALTEEHIAERLNEVIDASILSDTNDALHNDAHLIDRTIGYLENVFGEVFWEVVLMRSAATKLRSARTLEEWYQDFKVRHPDVAELHCNLAAKDVIEKYKPAIIEEAKSAIIEEATPTIIEVEKPKIINHEKLNAATNMLKLNLGIDIICQVTGLNEDTVMDLKKQGFIE